MCKYVFIIYDDICIVLGHFLFDHVDADCSCSVNHLQQQQQQQPTTSSISKTATSSTILLSSISPSTSTVTSVLSSVPVNIGVNSTGFSSGQMTAIGVGSSTNSVGSASAGGGVGPVFILHNYPSASHFFPHGSINSYTPPSCSTSSVLGLPLDCDNLQSDSNYLTEMKHEEQCENDSLLTSVTTTNVSLSSFYNATSSLLSSCTSSCSTSSLSFSSQPNEVSFASSFFISIFFKYLKFFI